MPDPTPPTPKEADGSPEAGTSAAPPSQEPLLLTRLVEAWEAESEARADRGKSHMNRFWEKWATPLSVLIGAAGIITTMVVSILQLNSSSEQFERSMRNSSEQFQTTMRRDQYSDIVDGLASSSVGVQVNSIRRLVQYVGTPDNFDSADERREAAANAVQTLAAFIQDESAVSGHEGLTDYRDPQPVVVTRAGNHLLDLMKVEGFSDIEVDLSRGNFHGVNLPDFTPAATFWAVGADFRAATVTGWDLREAQSPNLSNAFFTCADLQTSKLGKANVAGADFTGANLRGADFSQVSGLTTEQLSGARVGPNTLLPTGVSPPRRAWGTYDDPPYGPTATCRKLMEEMTHLLPGAGYSSRLSCPGERRSPWSISLTEEERDTLRRVCRFRAARAVNERTSP